MVVTVDLIEGADEGKKWKPGSDSRTGGKAGKDVSCLKRHGIPGNLDDGTDTALQAVTRVETPSSVGQAGGEGFGIAASLAHLRGGDGESEGMIAKGNDDALNRCVMTNGQACAITEEGEGGGTGAVRGEGEKLEAEVHACATDRAILASEEDRKVRRTNLGDEGSRSGRPGEMVENEQRAVLGQQSASGDWFVRWRERADGGVGALHGDSVAEGGEIGVPHVRNPDNGLCGRRGKELVGDVGGEERLAKPGHSMDENELALAQGGKSGGALGGAAEEGGKVAEGRRREGAQRRRYSGKDFAT